MGGKQSKQRARRNSANTEELASGTTTSQPVVVAADAPPLIILMSPSAAAAPTLPPTAASPTLPPTAASPAPLRLSKQAQLQAVLDKGSTLSLLSLALLTPEGFRGVTLPAEFEISRPSRFDHTAEQALGALQDKLLPLVAKVSGMWHLASETPGVHLWMVHAGNVHRWSNRGAQLVSTACFMLVHTRPDHTVAAGSGKFRYDVFLWLGSDADPLDAALCLTKGRGSLSESLRGGRPAVHREMDGAESERFLSLCDGALGGLRVLRLGDAARLPLERAGALSDVQQPRLLAAHAGAGGQLRFSEMIAARESLSSDGVYLLQYADVVWMWVGATAPPSHRAKTLELVGTLRNERSAGGAVESSLTLIELDETHSGTADFWTHLPGGSGPISAAAAAAPSSTSAVEAPPSMRWYRASMGTLEVGGSGPKIPRSELQSDGLYLLDLGTELVMWSGMRHFSTSSIEKLDKSFALAQDYAERTGKSAVMPISQIVEGGEDDRLLALLS